MPAALSRFGTLTEFDTLAEFDKVAEYSFGSLPMLDKYTTGTADNVHSLRIGNKNK